MAGAAAIVLAGLVALPVIALTSSSGRQRSGLVFTSAPSTTLPSAPTTATAVPSTTLPVAPTTTAVTATQHPATTTTTTLVCRNSYNPACGPFRWDPMPTIDKPTVSIKYSANGLDVTFTVTISDPDTTVNSCGQISFGDGGGGCSPGSGITNGPACLTRYGPWDPPAKKPDSVTMRYPHHYIKAGQYTVSAQYTVGDGCYDPYQGLATGSITVTVNAPPATTTTTSTTTVAP